MSNFVSDFVDSLYEQYDGVGDYSKSYFLNWVTDKTNLGKLNFLIGTSYSGERFFDASGVVESGAVYPEMNGEEAAIFEKLFECEFYKRQVRYSAQGMANRISDGSDWVSLKEGDTHITKINRNEILKNFRAVADSAKGDLEFMVLNYLKYKNEPEQLLSEDYDRYK